MSDSAWIEERFNDIPPAQRAWARREYERIRISGKNSKAERQAKEFLKKISREYRGKICAPTESRSRRLAARRRGRSFRAGFYKK